jgi:hypothetical protein
MFLAPIGALSLAKVNAFLSLALRETFLRPYIALYYSEAVENLGPRTSALIPLCYLFYFRSIILYLSILILRKLSLIE